jgi:hypothetical protein
MTPAILAAFWYLVIVLAVAGPFIVPLLFWRPRK